MARKQMAWKTKGMNRDLSVSAFNPEFAFENRNLRLGTNEANTVMSWVNEKGTQRINIVQGNWKSGDSSTRTTVTQIIGTPLGTAVINHQLVLFTVDTLHDLDYIYVLKYADEAKTTMLCKQLFGGENATLGFSIEHPIETLASYESETVQKVYWTDGINQPRVINIEGNIRKGNNTQFDFIPTLALNETVTVKKMLGANGMFAPSVIQYALTYYTKNGQESNIFYTSPLMYISYRDRGASPEDKVENAFKITVESVDTAFDYLRIYSIQRTSINSTPLCKRIQDISLAGLTATTDGTFKVSYIDTGTSGDSIDPTELLYKGGEVISAGTLEQKDNTLFLGNISITRPQITGNLQTYIKARTQVSQATRQITVTSVSTESYIYANQLTAYDGAGNSVPCGGFKFGDTYRLGVQFQYKTGKWSDPIWVKDQDVANKPGLNRDNTVITLPILQGTLNASDVSTLVAQGYKKVRGLVVFPKTQDRTVLCQGVINSTLWTADHHSNGDLYAQSSWFFRASKGGYVNSAKSAAPASGSGASLKYTHRGIGNNQPSGCHNYNPEESGNEIRLVEIQGDYEPSNKFKIDEQFVTFHSPDVEFDNSLHLTDYSETKLRKVGYAKIEGTMSDIEIQTESPTISSLGGGFVHKSFKEGNAGGIISGLFYDDVSVEETSDDPSETKGNTFVPFPRQKDPCKWMVYLWNMDGSLNNDINRPSDTGTASAVLKKKVISNLRYANTTYEGVGSSQSFIDYPRIFASDDPTIIKLGEKIYKGNIDTVLIPDHYDGSYFACAASRLNTVSGPTPFASTNWWKTWTFNEVQQEGGFYRYTSPAWTYVEDSHDVGDGFVSLLLKRNPIRIKYKSTAHLVFNQAWVNWDSVNKDRLPIVEITQSQSTNTRFGGTSPDALKENIWLPCGEPKLLSDTNDSGEVTFKWEYGDTYFQRWDCLKTYAYTREDKNQVVEIGSFMLETRTNIDGRYDRNRGQMNNLNMSPQNFNLMNPVYSQQDNFFQYKIQDDSFYENTVYPNQITWSKTKENGADVDLWTNITLASVLEMDGNKGEVTSLQRLNNQLICFQNSGISQILYNDNVQVSSTNGVPIEIANSGKVQGKDYKSDTVGCANKWSIQSGVNGLYFMDSDRKSIYLFNGQLTDVSVQGGFNAWSKQHIPANNITWDPSFPDREDKTAFITFYDRINQELLFKNRNTCLAFSERLGVFTSFYDYQGAAFFCNLDDTGIWLKANELHKHQAGEYCNFFGAIKPYSMVLVGNPEPQTDKIFTNLEFRACVDGDGEWDQTTGKFIPNLPFDSLETWDEYQYGIAYLKNLSGHKAMQHHSRDNEASLKRKFRIWRCDIPRDNGDNLDTFDETFDATFHPPVRAIKHPVDRMRNPWLYLRLRKSDDEAHKKVEIHDIVVTYFN